ncbi:N-formylglutamate amidohydrolase [Pseudorhodobacter turbinis]|uniref:N-formylglutamate amidohydrolase n=1 Tax=Pseudorhodobacter turbinis TaxID=2500533 RepID=A0A4P8EFH0_9RHOB|nr:N-formylglutamate amidohydrolase [Pseudorhodobacter turbinis]QCO55840.1 N-formylglutamate amidohydrolase [Pseudorhodobacter turbinis]
MTESAVDVVNPEGKSRVVLLCEHASNRFPEVFGDLGLAADDIESHAAWDPGALALAKRLSQHLDAPLVASTVSRLIYDCNRPPEAPSATPVKSELIEVPGNADLSPAEKAQRVAEVYDPFCAAVAKVLDARDAGTIVVTVHSFTPVYFGQHRKVELGLLHDKDSRLVDLMLEQRAALPHRVVERNQPYGPDDGVTHSLQKHAVSRGCPNVMLELRNDLLTTDENVETIANEILTLLIPAIEKLTNMENQK